MLFSSEAFTQSIDADSLYTTARSQAHSQQYDAAVATLRILLANYPERYNAYLLLCAVYSWDQKYDLARTAYQVLLNRYPTVEVYRGAGRVEMWDQEWSEALILFNQGLAKYPDDSTLNLLKVQTLTQLGRTEEAIAMLEGELATLPQADSLLSAIRPLNTKNAIRVGYYYAHFDQFFSPWQIGSLEYQRRTKLGSVIGRVSTARMFDQTGHQAEIDFYPKIAARTYGYANFGLSDGTVFPDLRWGAEIFQGVGSSSEISGGIRAIYFNPVTVRIYTAQLSYYHRSHWFSARGFLTSLQGAQTLAGTATYRRYFKNIDQHLSVYANYGNSPLQTVSLPEILRQTTRRIAVGYVHPFMQRTLLIHGLAEYQHETYDELRQVNRWGAEIKLEKRF
ncbi:MAG: YaiO family outer membrane beta-barrel protein [Bacteroidota bacterium]